MTEAEEKLLDSLFLEQFDIDKKKKVTTGLVMAIHRQLMTLSESSGTPIHEMDRAFIIERLCNVQVSQAHCEQAETHFERYRNTFIGNIAE